MPIEYSTMPMALRAAKPMSAIIAFRGSAGLTSPNARPTSFSYWPTSPNDVPSNVGDSTRVMSMRVMRASARIGAPSVTTSETKSTVRSVGRFERTHLIFI